MNTMLLLTTIFIFLLNLSPLYGDRVKREGFGPWEAQDTWDDKGKPYIDGSTLKEMIKTIEVVTQVIANASLETEKIVEEIVQAIEHPIDTMSHSKFGLIVLAIAGLVLVGAGIFILRLLWPVIKFVFYYLCWPFVAIAKFIYRCSCCMACCALTPFVELRNWYIRYLKCRAANKYDESVEVLESSGAMPLKRIYTRLQYDENGVYVAADEFTRVYIDDEADQIKAHLVKSPKRINGELSIKETMIVKSVPRPADKLPDFQGVFKIDDTIIGHFSCIKYMNETCLLTAYHVLDYNRNSIIKVCKGNLEIELNQIRADILSCSVTDQLDYIVLRVPLPVLSKLQLKIGKVADRLAMGSGIAIYQMMDNKPVYTRAIPSRHEKPWHIKYPASTIVGSSGAPILDIHHKIVGVHIESSPDGLFNVGVIPPFLRKYGKESPTNSDVLANAGTFKNVDVEEFLRTKYDFSEFDDKEEDFSYAEYTYAEYVPKNKEEVRLMSWVEQMNAYERNVNREKAEDYEFEITHGMDEGRGTQHKLYVLQQNADEKNHKQKRIKGDRYRKESPWSCSKCGLLHLKAGYNCKSCGYALRKVLEKSQIEETKTQVEKALSNSFPAEVLEKISKSVVDELTKKYNFESIVSESLNRSPASWLRPIEERKKEEMELKEKAKNLPEKVAMTKQLAQALDVKSVQPNSAAVKTFLPYSTKEQPKDSLAIATCKKTGSLAGRYKDVYTTEVLLQRNTKLDKSVKETKVPAKEAAEVAQEKPKKKRYRPRRKNRTAQATVPLNSQAPSRGGANGADGSKVQSLSHNYQLRSAALRAPSVLQNNL